MLGQQLLHSYCHGMLIEGVILFFHTIELFVDLEACTVRKQLVHNLITGRECRGGGGGGLTARRKHKSLLLHPIILVYQDVLSTMLLIYTPLPIFPGSRLQRGGVVTAGQYSIVKLPITKDLAPALNT